MAKIPATLIMQNSATQDDEESPVALLPGAKAMQAIAVTLKSKIEEYAIACQAFDQFVAVEGITRMTVTVTNKPINARVDRQWSFPIYDKNFDKFGEQVAKQLHARCMELYEEIQKLKDEL